jgi:putative ABC transport system permease protein
MRLTDILALARDNLSRARLRTLLTAMGVAIGTAAVITLISVGNGVESFTITRAASFGQLTLMRIEPSTAATRKVAARFHALTARTVRTVQGFPHVHDIYTYLAMPSLRLSVGSRHVDLPAAAQSPLTTTLTMVGRYAGEGSDGVLVPDTAAQALGMSPSALIGRRVTLTAGASVCCSSNSGGIVVLGADRHFAARVAGVYNASSWADPTRDGKAGAELLLASALGARIDGVLHNESATTYLNTQGYDLMYVHTDDARQTSAVADKVRALNYQVFDRSDLLAQVHTVFAILTAGLGGIGGIALLVAGVGIANTMIMTIMERTREIGIMKALGAEPGMVRRMFLVETALVGLIGGLGGIVLSTFGSVVGNAIFRAWLRSQGVTDAPSSLSLLSLGLIAGSLALAVAVSLIAGAWPSRRAVQLQPLEALRYE